MTRGRGRSVRLESIPFWFFAPAIGFGSCRVSFAGWLLLVACGANWAAPPPLEGFFPAGVTRGATNSITAIGKFETWPPQVWVSSPALTFVAETNKGTFSVAADADAAPGPHLVRLYNEEGASDARVLVVDARPAMADREPNNHFAKPQPVPQFPATINGRLDKNGDVDSFSVEVRAGEWLEARVDGYTLMSKVDPGLRLVTTNGHQLAWNHDFVSLDPRLVWRAPSDQTVVLQVFGFAYPPESAIRLAGGDAAIYRLHVSVTNQPPRVCMDSGEREPNDKSGEAMPIEVGAAIPADIGSANDEDRFQFSAAKGKTIEARVEAASFGSPLDAWLKIEDAAGHELARSDDTDGSRDPRLEWKATTNGSYIVAIGSVTHRGGDDFCYRLSLRELEPDYRATLSAGSLVLNTGTTNELKIEIKRLRGHTNELIAGIRDLPEGVTFVSTNLPKKDGTVGLSLIAAADAPKFQGPIQVVVTDSISKAQRLVPFELTTRGETAYTRLLIESTEDIWLTVRLKADEAKPAAKKK